MKNVDSGSIGILPAYASCYPDAIETDVVESGEKDFEEFSGININNQRVEPDFSDESMQLEFDIANPNLDCVMSVNKPPQSIASF